MNTDIYQTTACKGYKLDKVYIDIKTELISNVNLISLIVDERVVNGIKMISGEAKHIPAFSHPITIDDGDVPCVVIDIRRLIKAKSSEISDFSVANKPDYELLVLRARLLYIALIGDGNKLKDFDPLPATIFSRWVNNALAFKMNFIAHDQNIVTIISMAYYFKLYEPDLNVTELAIFIHRNTFIDPEVILDIFDADDVNEKLTTLTGLVDLLKETVSNIRIEKLSVPLLLASLTYGWRGSDAKETMAICLEHPPTWIACLATAIRDKNFKHSPIASLVKSYTRNNKDKEFLLRMEELLVLNERGR